MAYIIVRLEAPSPTLLRHVNAMVYITANGKRKRYWCEAGVFHKSEVKAAKRYAETIKRPGTTAYLVEKTG